jgi:predicted TIM-barrel fold metal-dependent hydrolase
MRTDRSPVLGVAHSPVGFTVPPGACDCHVHVFGPSARFPYAPERVYTPGDASIDDLSRLHRLFGIDRVIIVHPSPYGTDNACTVDALRRIGGRARGVAVIDAAAATEKELDAMHAAGVRGVRVNLATGDVNDPEAAWSLLRATGARVAPLGWHVQVFTTLPVIAALHDRLQAFPTMLVVDHFGGAKAHAGVAQPGFAALLSLVREGKTYVKLSAGYRVSERPDWSDVPPLAQALIEAGPERMLWGSDWPHPGGGPRSSSARNDIEPFRPIDDGAALNRLAAWAGDTGKLAQILVANPQRLYDFCDGRAASEGPVRRNQLSG